MRWMEFFFTETQTSNQQSCPVRREPHLSRTRTRKNCVCDRCEECEVSVLFTLPVACKGVAISCERNTLQGKKTNYRPCDSSDVHQADFSVETGHQVVDEEEESSDHLIHSHCLHCSFILWRSSIDRCQKRRSRGTHGFGFPTCFPITRTLFTAWGWSALFFMGPVFGPWPLPCLVGLNCRTNYFFWKRQLRRWIVKLILRRKTINKTNQRHMWSCHLHQGFTKSKHWIVPILKFESWSSTTCLKIVQPSYPEGNELSGM